MGKLLRRVSGAQLCYGSPVRTGSRTVIPVARVRAGGGFGRGGSDEDGGRGGGGGLRADPVGFIDIGDEGARFRPIVNPAVVARGAIRMGLAATAVAVAWNGRLPRRRRGLLRR